MSTPKNGGWAFPVSPETISQGTEGMTLRDWFAGMALQGSLAGNRPPMSYRDTARKAYEIADAMLTARKEGGV